MRILAIGLVCLAGCGSTPPSDQKNLVPIKGTITKDGKGVKGALVTFTPAADNLSIPATGLTKADGTYELTNVRGNKGLAPGNYRVTVSRRLMPDGKEVPPEDTRGDIDSPAKESLPAHYSNLEKTKLHAKVEAGAAPIDFDLK